MNSTENLINATGGLSTRQAQARLAEFGPNAVPVQRPRPILQFLRKFWSPVP